jgi:hypothetical protein
MGRCGYGIGRGRGQGYGRGLRRYFGWNQPQTKAEKKESLLEYRQALAEESEDVEAELKEL